MPVAPTLGETVVIGVGNPMRADDSVGPAVARRMLETGLVELGLTVAEVYVGGLALMEAMVGFRRAILVDAVVRGGIPGTVYRLSPGDLASSRNAACAHDMGLAEALELGGLLGLALPEQVDVWGVEPLDLESFSEQLTAPVARAVPEAAERIALSLSGETGWPGGYIRGTCGSARESRPCAMA